MYILECSDGNFYTGSTRNIERRFFEHQSSLGANYTKERLPVKLIYYEEFYRIDDAYLREKQVKKWSREKKIALINSDYSALPVLVKKVFRGK
ncbi:MAG TPA: GIY-YIG nuclease family protein [Ignavibacteriaceae bacterium]|nr:GIY-YIG nuclease family protein [Ignavibacteriaceae bacterium]